MNKKTTRIILDIDWESTHEGNNPKYWAENWDWNSLRLPPWVKNIKFVGMYNQPHVEKAENWIGN